MLCDGVAELVRSLLDLAVGRRGDIVFLISWDTMHSVDRLNCGAKKMSTTREREQFCEMC